MGIIFIIKLNMKLYKFKSQKKYDNIRKISNGKTNYLRNLNKRKNDGLNIIKKQKMGLMIEEIFKLNQLKRDYSHFSYNNSRFQDDIVPVNIHYSQAYNYPKISKIENDYSNKKNNIKFGKIPLIRKNNYSQFPTSNIPINYINNLNNNNKLAKAGKEIILKK